MILNAFSVSKTSRSVINASQVGFTSHNFYTPGGSFDMSQDAIIPDQDSVYWMHVAIDVPVNTPISYRLSGFSDNFIVHKTASLPAMTTISKAAVVKVSKGQQIKLLSWCSCFNGSVIPQPYWVGFRIDNIVSSLVYFSVARSTPTLIQSDSTPISYDVTYANVGNWWIPASSQFVPRQDGIFYFTFSGGVKSISSGTFIISLQKDFSDLCSAVAGVAKIVTGTAVDLVTRTCFTLVRQNQVINTVFTNTGPVFSEPVILETTFSGFMHSSIYVNEV